MYFKPTPRIGENVYCRFHDHSTHVVEIQDEITVRCQVCRYSRSYGQSHLSADVAAAKHALVKQHVVKINKGEQLLRTVTPNVDQTSLEDDPPF